MQYNVKDGLKYLGNENNPYICLMDTETRDITTATIDETCKVIYDYAFYWCSSLTSITIPDGVTSIGWGAFWNCGSLMSVTIDKDCKVIYYSAFEGCSSLTSITFNGTMAQWKAILKGRDWKDNVPAWKVVCSDGEVAL